jgi:hypothetical protein
VRRAHRALNWGKWKCISEGASVSGVSWKTIFTPSTVNSVGVLSMITLGSIRVIVPIEFVLPRPASTWPRGPRGSSMPYI